MEKNKLPDFVVFDLDNTIYNYTFANQIAETRLFKLMSDRLVVDEKQVKSSFKEARIAVKNNCGPTASSHNRLLYISQAFRNLGITLKPDLALAFERYYWAVFLENMHLDPGVEDFLSLLRVNGTAIALVTDLNSSIQYRKLIRLGIDSKFDFVITSEDAGGDKKTGKPFELLYKIINLKKQQSICFIGDAIHDFDISISEDKRIFLLRDKYSKTKLPKNQNSKRFKEFSEITQYWFQHIQSKSAGVNN